MMPRQPKGNPATVKGRIMQTKHPILFVGAGPGDPDLITVKGRRALREADVVVFAGSLVPAALLQWTGPETETHNSASMTLGVIIRVMAEARQTGKKVVRLHTGDPSLYGAIFEQMVELDRQSIPYRVIPGVTAAFAAAAALGIEYTIPEVSQTLILTRMAGRTPVPDSEQLATLASHKASMAIYLSIGLIDQVAPVLSAAYGAESMCAVVYRVSHPEEKVLTVPVGELVRIIQAEKITKHALIIVGAALSAREQSRDQRSRLYDAGFSHECRPCGKNPGPG
jgi:precorrin-4/cobalt-precorrin-4 C11-methyltransferase